MLQRVNHLKIILIKAIDGHNKSSVTDRNVANILAVY